MPRKDPWPTRKDDMAGFPILCPICGGHGETDPDRARVAAASPDLLASLIETRDAAAALMRAIEFSGHAAEVFAHVDSSHDGFGVRANAAIARATLPKPPESH